jgi:uncharacterized protein
MMQRYTDIEKILSAHKKFLGSRFHVTNIGVFGSYVRGEQTDKSDVDILVELSEPIGWEYVDLKEFLEEILGKPVDLVTRNALKRQLKDSILEEVRMV